MGPQRRESVMGSKEYIVGLKISQKLTFKVNKYAQILPIQLLNNFEKFQKITFWTPKIAKLRMSTWQKVTIFVSIFDLRAQFLAFWYFKKFLIVLSDS